MTTENHPTAPKDGIIVFSSDDHSIGVMVGKSFYLFHKSTQAYISLFFKVSRMAVIILLYVSLCKWSYDSLQTRIIEFFVDLHDIIDFSLYAVCDDQILLTAAGKAISS